MFRIRNTHGWLVCSLAVAVLAAAQASRAIAQPTDAKPTPKVITLNSLSMEVNALQTMHQLRLDKTQLDRLGKWADESIQKDQQRKPGKASVEYREKLAAMRKALQEAKDGDLIAKLGEEIDALHQKEKPTLDDRVEITEAARKRAAEAYRLLKPGQIAAYLGQIAESVHDPLDRLLDALEEARSMNEEDWKDQRDEIADDVSRLAVGLDSARGKRMSGQIATLLTGARGMTKAEFSKRLGELEIAARKIIGDVGPEVLFRNQVELELAMLLSNPRTPNGCRALMKASVESKK